MDRVKKLIGIVSGLFCTLIIAGLCSHGFDMDFKWYNSLVKPSFMPNGFLFSIFVSITYISAIWITARHVAAKKLLPAMPLLAATGIISAIFTYAFFTFKQIYLSAFFSALLFAVSFILLAVLLSKDVRSAVIYLPTFAFNCFCFVLMFSIAMSN